MHRGYIRLWRKITEWEWYDDIPTKVLFIHLALKANHQPKKWKVILIQKGEILTGRLKLSKQTGLSEQQVRSAIKKLKSTGEITSKTTSKYSIIKLINYDRYHQDNRQDNQQITNNQPTNNQQITTTKNEKNIKNEKNVKKVIPKGIEQAQGYGNIEINKMLEALKEAIGIEDFADSRKWSRIYGKHCLSLMRKIGKDEFGGRLEAILTDNFKRKNCNRIKYLYGELKSTNAKTTINEINNFII